MLVRKPNAGCPRKFLRPRRYPLAYRAFDAFMHASIEGSFHAHFIAQPAARGGRLCPVRAGVGRRPARRYEQRSEEHTSELPSLMRISYAVFCLKKKNNIDTPTTQHTQYNDTHHV